MRKALFTVSYAGLWGQERLDAVSCVHKAADLGYEGVLFMGKAPHLFPFHTESPTVNRIREALEARGLAAVGVAAYNDFLAPGPAEVPLLDLQVAYIESCCRLSSDLGGSVVRIFTGYLAPHLRKGEAYKRVIDTLRRCGDFAQRHNVVLAVQNHHDLAVHSEEMHLLLDEVDHPAVRAGFDAWSPYLRGEDLAKAASLMAPKTVMTIAANYKLFPQYVYEPDLVNYRRTEPDAVRATFMSEGAIDYQEFLESLRSNGFDGWVVYEMCSPLIGGGRVENLDKHAADFVRWMDEAGLGSH